jgi:serine/threonine-protein kinase
MSFHVGEDIGPYRIVSRLGAGSMGQVFQVEHQTTKRKEAMKVLLADIASDSQFLRFMREIEVQGRLDHPNIARVHDALHFKNCLILVMEFVEGRSLEKLLQNGRLPIQSGINYICQTLSGLQYAHDRSVVHRDVTPGNLIVTGDGRVKLTDFGLAKSLGDYQLTNDGDIVGSLYYMPPEQVRHQGEPDPRSDVYSTGAVLYEILTGKKLFESADRLSLMVAQVQKQPVPPIDIEPEIGRELNAIVLKALAKDPAERYQSAEEFRLALKRLGKSSGSAPRMASRVRVAALAVAICATAGIAGPELIPISKSAPAPLAKPVALERPAPLGKPTPLGKPAPLAEPTPQAKPAALGKPAALRKPAYLRKPAPPTPGPAARALVPAPSVPQPEPEIAVEKTVESEQPISSPHKKRGFWSKLNPFKRRKSDRSD